MKIIEFEGPMYVNINDVKMAVCCCFVLFLLVQGGTMSTNKPGGPKGEKISLPPAGPLGII